MCSQCSLDLHCRQILLCGEVYLAAHFLRLCKFFYELSIEVAYRDVKGDRLEANVGTDWKLTLFHFDK